MSSFESAWNWKIWLRLTRGAVDGEERVAGGGSDERDDAFFHVGEERVLLGFVEAVNFRR